MILTLATRATGWNSEQNHQNLLQLRLLQESSRDQSTVAEPDPELQREEESSVPSSSSISSSSGSRASPLHTDTTLLETHDVLLERIEAQDNQNQD